MPSILFGKTDKIDGILLYSNDKSKQYLLHFTKKVKIIPI